MGKTIPVYFPDDEMDLHDKVEKERKALHISKSGFIKMVLAEYFNGKEQGNHSKKTNPSSGFGDLLGDL